MRMMNIGIIEIEGLIHDHMKIDIIAKIQGDIVEAAIKMVIEGQ